MFLFSKSFNKFKCEDNFLGFLPKQSYLVILKSSNFIPHVARINYFFIIYCTVMQLQVLS